MLFTHVTHKYLKRDWDIDHPEQFAKKHAEAISQVAEHYDKLGRLTGWWFFPDPDGRMLDREVLLCLVFEQAFVLWRPHWAINPKVHHYMRFDEEPLFNGQESRQGATA